MSYRSDDPNADFDRWEAEQEKQLAKLPVCDYCDEPIQTDFCYEINDTLICEECLNTNFRKSIQL